MAFKDSDLSAALRNALFLYLPTTALQGERVHVCAIRRALSRFRPIGACVPASAGVDWVTSPLGRVVMVINGWFYHL